MVAYHFPPVSGTSGIQRTLRFVEHLPRFGWEPIVLTAHTFVYSTKSSDLLSDVPRGVHIERAFALDTARHLSIAGRYPGFAARPDRWVSWYFWAVPAGLRLIRRFRPDALWTTFPIASAHMIGATLARRGKLPWIADFRDPMAQVGYPEDPKVWRSFERVERQAVFGSAACTFTTPRAVGLYQQRYAEVSANHFRLIENGYDEETFSEAQGTSVPPLAEGKLTLVHSGIVYPEERNPVALIAALGKVAGEHPNLARRLLVRFRAPIHGQLLRELASTHGATEMIDIAPPVPYRDALREMLAADGLLLLQGANCSDQVPAKFYEYLRARRPIVALTNSDGDTAGVMATAGIPVAAPLDDAERIASALVRFVQDENWRDSLIAEDAAVAPASRLGRTEQLAALLEQFGRKAR